MQETKKHTFTVDIPSLKHKESSSLSQMFAKMDNEFLKHFSDRKDMLRTYRDIPIALQKLYS
jgi:hypothetical protein